MALRGSIADFGFADLLQLIDKDQKSGRVLVTSDSDDVLLLIRTGWIVSAENPERPNDSKLGTRLVRAGILTRAELGEALKRRAESDIPFADAVVELGYTAREVVSHHVALMREDIVLDVFTWPEGTYRFDEEPVTIAPEYGRPIALDQVLREGIMLGNEWPAIQRSIPSPLAVFERVEPLPSEADPAAALPFSEETTEPAADLSDESRRIHDLCLVGLDVQTVLDRSPYNRFSTLAALHGLISARRLSLLETYRA